MTFGYGEGCSFRLSSVVEQDDRITFDVNGEALSIPSIGRYNALNACAAVAVGDACGVEIDRIRQALDETAPMSGRARIHRGTGIVLIDDSYNANPTSMRVAVDSLVRLRGARAIAVLGDMAELGDFSDDAHRDIGKYVGDAGVDVLLWVGSNDTLVGEGLAQSAAKTDYRSYASAADVIPVLEDELKSGDVILVKASRSVALDVVVNQLLHTVVKEDRS